MATQADQTNTGVVTTIVVVGVFAMISIGALLTALVRSEQASIDRDRPMSADLDTVAALREQQLAGISAAPSWASEPGGKLLIPIDRAMRVVVDEYSKRPEAASPPPPPGLQMVTPPATPGGQGPAAAAPVGLQPAPPVPAPAAPQPAGSDPAVPKLVVPPAAAPPKPTAAPEPTPAPPKPTAAPKPTPAPEPPATPEPDGRP